MKYGLNGLDIMANMPIKLLLKCAIAGDFFFFYTEWITLIQHFLTAEPHSITFDVCLSLDCRLNL